MANAVAAVEVLLLHSESIFSNVSTAILDMNKNRESHSRIISRLDDLRVHSTLYAFNLRVIRDASLKHVIVVKE